MLHIMKNVRNNLLAAKRMYFHLLNSIRNRINVNSGYVSWSLFYELYENDLKLQANLKRAHKITYRVGHPGNNKQNVSLTWLYSTKQHAAILSYFPKQIDAASFLQLFNKLFLICNSKQQFHTSKKLGNAVVNNDNKPEFL